MRYLVPINTPSYCANKKQVVASQMQLPELLKSVYKQISTDSDRKMPGRPTRRVGASNQFWEISTSE